MKSVTPEQIENPESREQYEEICRRYRYCDEYNNLCVYQDCPFDVDSCGKDHEIEKYGMAPDREVTGVSEGSNGEIVYIESIVGWYVTITTKDGLAGEFYKKVIK